MARFRRRRFLGRRGRGVRPHWAANMFFNSGTETDLPELIGNVIVDVPDYQGNNFVSPSGVTLLRCVVNSCFCFDIQGAFGGDRASISYMYGLVLQDPDDLILPDPGARQDLINERWLHIGHRSAMVGHGTAPTVEVWPTIDVAVDVKQKAKLRNMQLLWMVKLISNLTTPQGNFSWHVRTQARALLVGDVT